jgi:hypothetical protein
MDSLIFIEYRNMMTLSALRILKPKNGENLKCRMKKKKKEGGGGGGGGEGGAEVGPPHDTRIS